MGGRRDQHFAEEAKRVYGEVIPSARADQRFLVRYEPVGVVGAITPWNYPVSMITRKVAPALAAGCTVVLKPAESTPLCAVAIFELLEEAGLEMRLLETPGANPVVFGERRATLESSVDYLEQLAGTYSRIASAPADPECDVGAVIREIRRDTPVRDGLDVVVRVDEDVPALGVDANSVRRVVDNLVRNAIESLPDGQGLVTIAVSRTDPPGVRVSIEDTGEGMTPEQLERAFEHGWTTRDRGSGLGLTIVRDLVSAMHGTVTAESVPGKGTRIVIDIPTGSGGERRA